MSLSSILISCFYWTKIVTIYSILFSHSNARFSPIVAALRRRKAGKLSSSLSVARMTPRTSKGITDVLLLCFRVLNTLLHRNNTECNFSYLVNMLESRSVSESTRQIIRQTKMAMHHRLLNQQGGSSNIRRKRALLRLAVCSTSDNAVPSIFRFWASTLQPYFPHNRTLVFSGLSLSPKTYT